MTLRIFTESSKNLYRVMGAIIANTGHIYPQSFGADIQFLSLKATVRSSFRRLRSFTLGSPLHAFVEGSFVSLHRFASPYHGSRRFRSLRTFHSSSHPISPNRTHRVQTCRTDVFCDVSHQMHVRRAPFRSFLGKQNLIMTSTTWNRTERRETPSV